VKFLALLLALLALPAGAETTAAKLFSAKPEPTSGASIPIGAYGRGCASGNVELPETGPTWQAMRLSRNRNWGNPTTVAYLEELSAAVQSAGWRGLYIGDIGNPRGGPMNSGHASHQMGLDVDIWFSKPDRLDHSRKERENMSAISIRSDDQLSVNGNYDPSYAQVLKLAASDPRVDRIFVAAAIKIEMCKSATAADKAWLQKIRPEANHQDHMHVRLKCPKGSPLCEKQKPTVSDLSKGGSGCDDTLMYWVSDAYLHPKPSKTPAKPQPHKKGARELLLSDLPEQCAAVLSGN
jgi:penicillin-insensitive murein endopeptidase